MITSMFSSILTRFLATSSRGRFRRTVSTVLDETARYLLGIAGFLICAPELIPVAPKASWQNCSLAEAVARFS